MISHEKRGVPLFFSGRDLIDVLTPDRVKADGTADDDFISRLGDGTGETVSGGGAQ